MFWADSWSEFWKRLLKPDFWVCQYWTVNPFGPNYSGTFVVLEDSREKAWKEALRFIEGPDALGPRGDVRYRVRRPNIKERLFG